MLNTKKPAVLVVGAGPVGLTLAAELQRHLEHRGGKVEHGVRLSSFTQRAEGVTVELMRPRGVSESLRVPWLVGCDGAFSSVRGALGLPFEGETYHDMVLQADLRIRW